MQNAAVPGKVFRFGLFEADVARNALTRNGTRVRIQDQPFRVLILLLERPGEIVTREELRLRLWPEGTFVDFDGSLNVIVKRLRGAIDDDSENPRFIETVPRRGYRFIAPVSVKGESDRSVSGDHASPGSPLTTPATLLRAGLGQTTVENATQAQSLAAEAPSQASLQERPSGWGFHRILVFCVVAALLGLSVVGLWWQALRQRFGPEASAISPAPPISVRKAVAVLGFRNLSGRAEDAWLGPALAEMLSTELAAGDNLRLVSGEAVAQLRVSSPWTQTDTLDQGTTSRIGNALNGDLLVLGSFTSLGPQRGQLRVDVRLQNARTGEILAEVGEIGGAHDLFQTVARVGDRLRERIGVPPLQDADQAGILAALPLNREAAKFYALGISKLRNFDPLSAKDLLEQATKADPQFSLGHAMLARAWSQLGYEQKRREEAKKALDLSSDLPRPQRMLVEAEYYRSVGDQNRAASTLHALFELFPDNVEYGVLLASAQSLAGRGSEALATIAQLRRLPPPACNDPAIDLQQARMELKKSASLDLIHSALGKAQAQGNKLLYAQAQHDECITLVYGENPQGATPSCEEAYNSFLGFGNQLAAADTLRLIGDRQGAQGDFDKAAATYSRVIAMLQTLGDHEKMGAVLNNLGSGLMDHGQLDRAEQLFKQAKLHFDQAGDRNNAAIPLTNLADLFYLRGKLTAAEHAYQQAIKVVEALDPPQPGYLFYRLADLELAQGRTQQAGQDVQHAINSLHGENAEEMSGALVVLGHVLKAGGDVRGARDVYEQSLNIRQKRGDATLVAEAQLALADVLLEQKQPQQAEIRLRDAIAQFEKANSPADATSAYTTLSRAYLTQGDTQKALRALDRAANFDRRTADPALKLQLQIQTARIAAASPEASGLGSARKILQAVIATSRKLGYFSLECEARELLAESELQSRVSTGRIRLAEIAADARAHGLELLARKAEEAASPATAVEASGETRASQ